MAFSQSLSSSLKKGQVVLQCQLCENDPKLKWKCLDCGFLMCQRCTDKVHPKFPSAEDHTIIDIKDISKHQTHSDPKPDLTKLKCEVHNGQTCSLYCETCESLVCQTCVTKTHKKHEFGEINDEYKIRLEKIQIGHKNIKKGLLNLIVSEQKLKQVKATEQLNYEHVKQEILDYEKVLIGEIKKHTDKHLKTLDQRWNTVSNLLDNEEKTLKETRRQIQDILREVNNLLQPGKAKNVFSVPESLSKSMKTEVPPIKTTFNRVPKFNRGDISKIQLGTLEDSIIQCNTVPATGPRHVVVMDQTGHQEKVFKYDRHNKLVFVVPFRITSMINNKCSNIAVIDLVSDDGRGRVVVLNQDGEVRNIYTGHPDVNNEDKPFRPMGITTTPLDNFVVSDGRALHILNYEGEILTFYDIQETWNSNNHF